MRGKGKCEGERQCQGRGGEGGDRCEGQTRGLRTQLGTNCIVDCISQNSGRDEHSKQRTNAQLPHALCTAHKVRTRGEWCLGQTKCSARTRDELGRGVLANMPSPQRRPSDEEDAHVRPPPTLRLVS